MQNPVQEYPKDCLESDEDAERKAGTFRANSAAKITISCGAAYGGGGLGQHLTQVIEEARERGALKAYYARQPKPLDEAGRAIGVSRLAKIAGHTPLRFNRARILHLEADLFDRDVARELTGRIEAFVGFVGQSLHSFKRARELGARRLELHAANSHVENVMRQHVKARQRFSIESPWIGDGQRAKTLKEYEEADVIWVASEYTRRTFLDTGISGKKLARIHLKTASRFQPPATKLNDGIFRVVFVGNLTVGKGVPLLIEAFSKLALPAAELTLVGGWSTRGMGKYLQEALRRDPRIRIAPGDPLLHLQKANVCVHPTYEDGWAYAPAEALACGIPLIVSEDTGMKELVREGINGHIVPTGDEDALLERLEFLATR